MGQQKDRQGDLMVSGRRCRARGHVFYGLQSVLIEGGFDAFADAGPITRPSRQVPPGRYFRMHLRASFEGIDSERGLEWRCSDSLSLREFLRLEPGAGAGPFLATDPHAPAS